MPVGASTLAHCVLPDSQEDISQLKQVDLGADRLRASLSVAVIGGVY